MNNNPKQLIIPPSAIEVEDSFEVLRVWTTPHGPVVSLLPDAWADPAAWGILLVDIARHLANAKSSGVPETKRDILSRLKAGFDAEWGEPTDTPQGQFVSD